MSNPKPPLSASTEHATPRVLLISQFLVAGGLERMVHLLGGSLARDFNSKVFLFSFDLGDDEAARRRLAESGVTAIYRQKGRGFCLKTLFRLIRLIRNEQIDIIHTHESAPLMYATFAKLLCFRAVRIIHTQHSFIHLETRPHIRRYDVNFQRAASFVTAVSPQVRDKYEELGVPKERVLEIGNGIEFPERLPDPEEKARIRARLLKETAFKQAQEGYWLISLARIHSKKGQDHVIRVWAALPTEVRKKSWLLLVGPATDANELARLREMAAKGPDAERVIFTGPTSEPVSWLLASDLFISGSEYEGMPLAPIEACGAGLPVVLSDIKGHRLLEQQARYFPFESPEEGAKQVLETIEEQSREKEKFRRDRLRVAAEMQARYSIQKMAGEYFELYQRALKR